VRSETALTLLAFSCTALLSAPTVFAQDLSHGSPVNNNHCRGCGEAASPAPLLKKLPTSYSVEERLGPWLADAQRRIHRLYTQEKLCGTNSMSCTFRVMRNGELAQLTVLASSGSRKTDEAVLKLIKQASPRTIPWLNETPEFVVTFSDDPSLPVKVRLAR
jgi:TonB family protein